MDKGLTVPKWVLINCPKICLPKPKVCDFDENRLHWASGSPCLVKSTTTKLDSQDHKEIKSFKKTLIST